MAVTPVMKIWKSSTPSPLTSPWMMPWVALWVKHTSPAVPE